MKQSNLKILKQVNTISCKDCLYNDHRCVGAQNTICGHFCPVDEREHIDTVVSWMKDNIVPSKDTVLRRRAGSYNSGSGVVYDDIVTLDNCYVRMINDALKEIRRGKITYLYSWEQVADVMRFEKDISVEYKDGVFYVVGVKV